MATEVGTQATFEVDIKDVVYQRQAGTEWLARMYQPRGSGPFPTVVDVHGGAWHNGTRASDDPIGTALAARGILVASLDFRQPPEAGYPASVCDVNLGIRWLKAHAADFNGVADIGGMGASSGGHQIVLAAMRPRDPRYASLPLDEAPDRDASLRFAIACWPVIDPLYRYQMAREAGRAELVKAHDAYWGTEEAMADGSPQCILDRGEAVELPPVLIIQRQNDVNHPLIMQERFLAAYRRAGGDAQMEMFTSIPAPFKPTAEDPESLRVVDVIEKFIKEHS